MHPFPPNSSTWREGVKMEFAPLSTNSPSKHPLNAMTSVQQFDVEGGHGGDTMTPSPGRRVDIQDVKESPPGDTSESPIILDEISGEMAAKNSSSPTFDDNNVSTPLPKETPLVKVTPSLPKSRHSKEGRAKLKMMKEEQKAQREREKAERERERAEKKAQKESEREAKKQEKEKELKEKREKQEQREAEKRKKLEDNQLKQEAKRRKEQEERERQDKRQQHFMSFFEKKSSPKGQAKETSAVDQKDQFPPLPSKPGVTVAKLPSPLKDSSAFDSAFASQEVSFESDFLRVCQRKRISRKSVLRPKLLEAVADESSTDCIIVGGASGEEMAEQYQRRLKYKLLQFHENFRPAYWGTWRKRGSMLSPRNPFKKDESLLNYDIESDDEWEEEEQGESISSSEGEEEPVAMEGEDDEDDDGFFVPHGYLSEGEGDVSEPDMEADSKEPSTVRIQSGKERDKAALWDLEASRIQQPLKPICIGCIFEGDQGQNPKHTESVQLLNQFRAVLLTDGPIDPLQQNTVNAVQEVGGMTCKTPSVGPTKNLASYQPVPEEAMPDLIRFVHGSSLGLQRIIKEFRQLWGAKKVSKTKAEGDVEHTLTAKDSLTAAQGKENVDYSTVCGISKRQLECKIQQIAKKEARLPDYRHRFYVHSDVLEKYGLDPAALAVGTMPVTSVSPFSRSSGNQNVHPPPPNTVQTPTRKRAAAMDLFPECFSAKTPITPMGVSHGGLVGVSPGDSLDVVPTCMGGPDSGVEATPTIEKQGVTVTDVHTSVSAAAADDGELALPPEKRLKVDDKRLELSA